MFPALRIFIKKVCIRASPALNPKFYIGPLTIRLINALLKIELGRSEVLD